MLLSDSSKAGQSVQQTGAGSIYFKRKTELEKKRSLDYESHSNKCGEM